MKAIYARISDDDQSKYSITDQLKECRQKAGTTDVIEYIDEGVTGAIIERPALTKLRNDVKMGIIDTVICWDPDRFSRDLTIQLLVASELEKRAELVFVNHEYKKTPEGILFFQMRGAFSQFEKAKITERTSRGRKSKAEAGKVVKNSYLYGYKFDEEKSTYYINEDEAQIVRFIFDAFTKPSEFKGINGIAKHLTTREIPTKRGAPVWHRQVVRQILLNPSYKGLYIQRKWNTEGMVGNKYRPKDDRVKMKVRPEEDWISFEIPSIISEAQFEHAQELIGVSRRRHTKDSLRQYLLSGIVRCGHCGNTMTGRRGKNWGTYHMEYTDIKNYAGAKLKGCGMKIRCEHLDGLVWDKIMGYINNQEAIAATEEEEALDYEVVELARMEREIEKAKVGRRRLLKLLSSGEDIDEDEIRVEMKELSEKEQRHVKQKEEILRKKSSKHSTIYRKSILEDAVHYFVDKSDELTFENKKDLLRMLVKEVIVYRDKVDVTIF